ncbi:MAG: BlaI/MecI/CopY family transcriptional regulator [Acidobacteriota bacterium]
MTPTPRLPRLSRREREILDVLYALGQATVQQVLDGLADPPSYSAVRALLRILEEKGHVRHDQDGPRYVYTARQPRDTAARSALGHLVRTFYDGSVGDAVSALLDASSSSLSNAELDKLAALIDEARRPERTRR